jgi:MFS family permease
MLTVLNLFFYAFALPLLSRQLQSRLAMSAEQAAWMLAVISGAALLLGTLIIGLCLDIKCLIIGTVLLMLQVGSKILTAAGLVIQSAGCGVRFFLISLVSTLVDESQRARLFTSIGLVDTVGIIDTGSIHGSTVCSKCATERPWSRPSLLCFRSY